MLASTDTYTVTVGTVNTEYGCIYYNNTRYNVLWADVKDSILSSADVATYVTGTLWKPTTYESLKRELNLKRNMAVYGLQMALQTLGFYSGTLDGSYGTDTEAAVTKFQKAYMSATDVDGYAGQYTQKVLYPLAIAAYAGSGSSGSSGGTSGTAGTLVTSVSLNLRKSSSTKSARLAVVPKKTTLAYYQSTTTGGVTWYYVTYNNVNGWLMGTYVTADGSSGGGSGGSGTSLGTVTITMANTRVRKTANGAKSGYVLAKGSTVTLLASPTTSGGYTWYYIQTASGYKGYVRGDCATANYESTKTYIKLPTDVTLFTSTEESSTGAVTVAAGTVLQMVTSTTYTKNSVEYCSLYYNSKQYNCVYSKVKAGILSSADLITYITKTLWAATYSETLKEELDLIGSVKVHALQYALTVLGYYTGNLDGNFGSGTTSAVRNYQRQNKLTVDGSVGPETYPVLFTAAMATLSGSGGGTITSFGTINSIQKASWNFGDNGGVLFPKSSTATVLDVETQVVFSVKRWSGAYHADCVPLTEADTKKMCDIVGFTYNSNHPTSAQISKIKGDSDSTTYIWPDFSGAFGGKNIGSKWDRRPALLNVGGKVYCVSIYGWPHGYGSNATCDAYAAGNNYYGMMCIHFVGSYTHVNGKVDSGHQAAIDVAYAYAKSKWPSLVK